MSQKNTSEVDFFDGPLSRPSYIIMGLYMSVIGLASYIGNGLMLFLFIKNRLFRKSHINLFILNIVIANLGESLLGFPFGIVSNFSTRWAFGTIGCSFYGFICYTCVLATMCTFLAISIYRYNAVCKPNLLQRFLTPRRIPQLLVAIWVYSLLWTVMPFLGFGEYGPEPFKTTCSLVWTAKDTISITYTALVGIFVLFVPVSIMIVAYVRILCMTYTQVSGGKLPDERSQFPVGHAKHGVTSIRNIESRTTKIVFTSVVMYLIAWLPYGVMSILSMCGVFIPIAFTTLPTMFAKSQCAYNPIIYFLAHRRFRVSLLELFGIPAPSDAGTEGDHRLQVRAAVNGAPAVPE